MDGEDGAQQDVLRLGDSLRRRSGRPGLGPFAISFAIHGAALAVFLFAGNAMSADPTEYQTVAIHLVSPPPTVLGEPEPVQTTAAVAETPKEVVEPVKAPAKPVEKPKAQTQSALDKKVVSKPAKPAQGLNPKPGPVGGEGLNIVQDGVAFPYPDYLNNVIFRLSSSLRWQGQAANLTAEVGFYIKRDGSVTAIKVLRESGNDAFDLAAVAAVENAGRMKVIGPLPREWQGDRLAIRFTFVPNN